MEQEARFIIKYFQCEIYTELCIYGWQENILILNFNMKIEGPLIPATFVERPNRFITLVSIDGYIHRSHLPDPGPVSYTHLTLPTICSV